jgi:nucleotide-binding universal stress UspA family protein
MAKLSKILVPTDLSEVSNRAAKIAVDLAKTNNAKLILMTVIDALPSTDEEMIMLRVSVDSVKAYNEKKFSEAEAKLRKLISPTLQKKLGVKFIVRDGKKPYAEIIRLAEELAVDLIVMSSHGRGRLLEILLGGNTNRVVQEAPCSVLVVRPNRRGIKIA